MSRPSSHLRRLTLFLAVAALVAAIAPLGAQAASRSVRLEAGPQRGYLFTASGAVRASKAITVSRPATVLSSARTWITGRGVHLKISSGSLAGYYVPESIVAYIPGVAGSKTYSPAAKLAVPAGRHLAFTFDSSWRITGTRYRVLAAASSASISRRAVIHGRPFARVAAGTWAGYWLPLAGPRTLRADPMRCSSPGHVAAGSQQVFRVLPGAQNQVALTFDMGGRIEPGLDIVNRLLLDRVCTTFFPTGAMTATAEGQRIVKLIGAHPELFELGNHTQHHCNLRDGGGGSPTSAPCPKTPPTKAFIAKELLDAAAILKAASGMEPAPYWRVPYGASSAAVLAAGTSVGYTKSFLWDVDTIDWRPVSEGGPNAAQIAAKVVANSVNGSNVLMHLGGYHTYDALPSMVYRLRAKGLQPTTISDILR